MQIQGYPRYLAPGVGSIQVCFPQCSHKARETCYYTQNNTAYIRLLPGWYRSLLDNHRLRVLPLAGSHAPKLPAKYYYSTCTSKVIKVIMPWITHLHGSAQHETDGLSHAPIHDLFKLSRIRWKYRYFAHVSAAERGTRRGGGVFLELPE